MIEEMERLNAERTQGEWAPHSNDWRAEVSIVSMSIVMNSTHDAAFIAASANNMSQLLSLARAGLEAEKMRANEEADFNARLEAFASRTLDAISPALTELDEDTLGRMDLDNENMLLRSLLKRVHTFITNPEAPDAEGLQVIADLEAALKTKDTPHV